MFTVFYFLVFYYSNKNCWNHPPKSGKDIFSSWGLGVEEKSVLQQVWEVENSLFYTHCSKAFLHKCYVWDWQAFRLQWHQICSCIMHFWFTDKFGNRWTFRIYLVACNSFLYFPTRRFWWVIITTLIYITWYHNQVSKTAHSFVNMLLSILWHSRSP